MLVERAASCELDEGLTVVQPYEYNERNKSDQMG